MVNELNKSTISELTTYYLQRWWEASTDFPKLSKEIGYRDKISNERKIEGFRKDLSAMIKGLPQGAPAEAWSKELFTLIKDLEGSMIGYGQRCIDFFSDKGYSTITEDFIKEIKAFDPEINFQDVFQAIRNVWIMNSIQIILGIEVTLTPSIFSYSMLYPYSDNYLDDISVTQADKISFNKRFQSWLMGYPVEPCNTNEARIYKLVQRIETEYPRNDYPQVFNSLLGIHQAQERSLLQQRGGSIPYERDILGISFEKGGSSVLADGYLVKGNLTNREAIFMFGYGVFLQIIDDLQDVEADLKQGHMTIFSQLAKIRPLDHLVNKLFWFIEDVLNDTELFSTEEVMELRNVMHESCRIMIFEAIAKNKKMFTNQYIREIEKYSILRLTYYKKIKKKFLKSFTSEELHQIITGIGNKQIEPSSI